VPFLDPQGGSARHVVVLIAHADIRRKRNFITAEDKTCTK